MNIEKLCGFTLDSCRFSKASYTFEFSGKLEGNFITFLVSTSCYFSKSNSKKEDARENFSSEIWDMIEKKLISISIDNSGEIPAICFAFETDGCFYIWYDEPLIDNMLIVTNTDTDEWFPVC